MELPKCDFVVREKNSITHLIQVCYDLSMNNQQREINGLLEVMSYFDVSRGTIVTFDQKDEFILDDKTIEVIPAHFWLMHF